MDPICDLTQKHCKPCEGGVPPLSDAEIRHILKSLNGWEYKNGVITKAFKFKDHYQVVAFINAIAWISHKENHHPDIQLGYNSCEVAYKTHAIHGISENDGICAAKVDSLFNI